MYLDVANQFWVGLDTPRSLTCALLLKYGEYAQLVNLAARPQDYTYDTEGGQRFMDDYQATELLAKWPNFVHVDLDPISACEKADHAAELACRVSNRRLRKACSTPTLENSAYLHLITQMQADIERVLGGFDPSRWEDLCRFGPGKATDQDGVLDYDKIVSQPSATEEFLPFGVLLLSGSVPWLEALSGTAPDPFELNPHEDEGVYCFDVTLTPGDRNIMVPKNAKTMRGIRPQPGLNVFAQLGLGSMIRDRLKSAGLDLDDQLPNQQLAKFGSQRNSDHIVTIDLKGASGHICKELIALCFERLPRWKFAMDLCRTSSMLPHGSPDEDDEYVPLYSYSAMGNGFTFELETLVFWAAVRACRRSVKDTQQYRVYGDDIICSRLTADLLIPFLDFLGFPTNPRKTFVEGPFRESCGADYWYGANIRPIHFSITSEEILEANRNGTSILRWLQTSNAVRRLARARNHSFGCDRRLLPAWRTAILRIPRNLRDSLKSPWTDIRDDSLITDDGDAASNPLVSRCGSLQALTSPRLHVVVKEKVPGNFLGSRATLLYRQLATDRVTVRYDRTRSWLRRVLQTQEPTLTRLQGKVNIWSCTTVTRRDFSLPNFYALEMGAGWEVFQPVADTTIWL
jgi:hypothetical protein